MIHQCVHKLKEIKETNKKIKRQNSKWLMHKMADIGKLFDSECHTEIKETSLGFFFWPNVKKIKMFISPDH